MNRYIVLDHIGRGSFGDVYLAIRKDTGEKRAIKRLVGIFSWERIVSLRELQCIVRLKSHPNIVQMLEVIRCENDWAFFVFEYMGGGDLLKWKESHQQNGTMPQDPEIRCILQQLFRALAYMHSHGIYHRDLKPENILLDGRVCKIADFSLSRYNDETEAVTEYVSTRWYRAPEVAMACRLYAEPVDMFAVGAIAVELYTLKVLFPAKNELELLSMMFAYLGTPEACGWKEGMELLSRCPINTSQQDTIASPFRSVQTSLPSPHSQKTVTIDLMVNLLSLDPSKRITAAQALEHPFFVGFRTDDMVQQPTVSVSNAMTMDGLHSGDEDGDCVSSHATPKSNEFSLQLRQNQATMNMVTVSPATKSKPMTGQFAATKLPFLSPDNGPQLLQNPYTISALRTKRHKTQSS